MKMKTIICCLFALCFFLVVTGRNILSTALSSDVNFEDPPLPPFLPPPPPSPLVNGGDVVPQTPSLSKPPSPVVNSDPDSQNINKEEKMLIILIIILLVVLMVFLIAFSTVVYFLCRV